LILDVVVPQLSREKKTLEDHVVELKAQLGDEEERAKTLSKLKNKYEAIIAELEEKLRKEQEV
jgi:myosin protein heavy chain